MSELEAANPLLEAVMGYVLPAPNLPELRKAMEWVEEQAALPEEDSQWFQGDYVRWGSSIGRTCTSAYCVAGFVASQRLSHYEMIVMGPDAVDRLATEVLGLTQRERSALFNGSNDLREVRRVATAIAYRAGERL